MPFLRIDIARRHSILAYLNLGSNHSVVPCEAQCLDFDDPSLFRGQCGRPTDKVYEIGGSSDVPLCRRHAVRAVVVDELIRTFEA
jgi:hypothetical protein